MSISIAATAPPALNTTAMAMRRTVTRRATVEPPTLMDAPSVRV